MNSGNYCLHSSTLRGNGLQNTQKVNNWWYCEHVLVIAFSCKWWERSERKVLKFLYQALWDVSLSELLKAIFHRWILLTYLGWTSGRIMVFNLKIWYSALALSNRKYIFSDPNRIFQIPIFNMTIRAFIYWNTFHFSNFLEWVTY